MNTIPSPTVRTRLAVLFGHPLGHTLSPAMHNRAFQFLGLDWFYLPVEVKPENLEKVFKGLCLMNVGGFNVTIPHKVAIKELLDELDPLAATIGAVNTIAVKDGRTIGYNTDGYGFIESLKQSSGIEIAGQSVFIFGAGGAARAIGMSLAHSKVGKIFLTNRTIDKAEALAMQINSAFSPCVEVIDPESPDFTRALRASNILVNSTSIGMSPHTEQSPIAGDLLHKDQIVADIVYNPLSTRLLRDAEKAGCKTVPGPGMLIHQGAAAFSIWTGKEAPVKEMSEIIYNHLK